VLLSVLHHIGEEYFAVIPRATGTLQLMRNLYVWNSNTRLLAPS